LGEQGYLGVRIENVSNELGEYFGVEEGEGVLVLEVVDDSPADLAGLEAGDVIVEIDGRKMFSTDKLVSYIGDCKPGKDVEVTFKRKRRTRMVEVELGEKEGPDLEDLEELEGDIEVYHMDMEDLQEELQNLREDLEELREEIQNIKE
jgi:S1-C subfamily serine protease